MSKAQKTVKQNPYSPYASSEEYWYSKWLDKLKQEGYVIHYDYQIPFSVLDEVKILDTYKLNALNYTADFNVYWSKKALEVFIKVTNNVIREKSDKWRLHQAIVIDKNHRESHPIIKTKIDNINIFLSTVDTKGKFAGKHNNSAITFPLIQKIMWNKHKIYINKVMPFAARGLFNYTFTPSTYIITKTGKPRKVVFKTRTFNEYINIYGDE